MVMLRDKGIVCCTKSTIKACQNRASLYVREREAAGEITSSVAASMVNYKMDKRTFLRTITTLASEQRVHHRAVAANPNKSRNLPMLSHLAIAWEIDPNGERVDAFIEALKDSMIINSAGLKLRLPPLVENSALVQRTTGSKERDRRYIDAKLGVARFRSTVATTRRKRFKRLAAEVESGVAYDSRDDGDDEPLYKRAKRENMRAGRTGKDPAWEEVKQEMEYLGGAMVRLQTLHQFLIKELPRSIDNIRVYPNYIFRIPYLLYALPLRLHIQLCKGAWYTHAAIRYVRYGNVRPDLDDPDIYEETEEQRKTRLSAADEDEDELVPGTSEEMARRLNTPIGKLPQELIAMIMSKVNRSRVLVQRMLYQMYILQLVQPILREPDLTSDREPADAKDVFKDPPLLSKNQSTIGYQLIGKARILNRKGYRCAVETDKFSGKPVSQDLSVNYLNDNVHNVLDMLENLQYWDELQTSSQYEGDEIGVSHPLFRINSLVCWRKQSKLNRSQIETLDRFVNSLDRRVPPMFDLKLLKRAAKEACVSLPEARMYFRKVEARFRRNIHIRHRKHFEESLKKDASTVAAREMNKINMAKGTPPPPLNDVSRPPAILPLAAPPRRRWSAEDQHLLILTFVVVKCYAQRHKMPVLLMPALKVFPDRFDVNNRTERLRHQWGNMMHRDHYRSLSECLMTLWPHIFDDALSKGELTDTSNREKWDIVKEVYYLHDLLQKNTLLEILEQYKEKLYYDYVDVADEQQPDLFEYLQNMARTGTSKLAELARRAQADNEPGQEHLSEKLKSMLRQKHAKEKVKIVKSHLKFLPETLEEFKLRYVIVSKDAKPTVLESGFKYEFPEDSLRRGSNMHSTFQQLRMAKNTMYTMRQGWSCLADESNPVTTHLQLSDDGMPVKVPVSAYTPRLVYIDMMQNIYPVVRILNARVLRRAFNQLVSNPVLVVDDTAIDEIGRLCMDRYVSSTRLRAIITNLVLTPNDEYDESLANKLLLPDKYVSELVIKYIQRTFTITKLASNAMSVGLAKLVFNNAPEPITWPSETQTESSVGSTVVVHETSGATRVGAAEARPGTHTAGEVDDSQPGQGGIERRAPGRGFAISERFATVLNGNLPASFLKGSQQLPELSTTDHHWAPADSAYSLSLFAQGRLWLRPVYSAKPDAPFGPMAGFQRRLNLHVVDFDLRASIAEVATMDVDGDQQDGSNLALSPEILEKVLSALAMLVHETGAMGVALGELQSLISRMFEKTTMDMPEYLQTILQSRSALQTLVGMLVSSKRLVVVGCTDQRYVSERYYRAQWMTTVDDPPLKLVPYLGQSLNGSANMALLLNMVRTLTGQILEHPGISQTNLMRRHFAPHVAKAEIQRFLDILCSHKIIDKRESEVPANSGVYITTYRTRLDYYSKLRQLSRSLGDLLPLDS
ncbi:hypothetical protein EC988_001068 [Linderina pennispora]|nr:hypothetical protein EC988_001068 [Linderina pennispora]